MSDDPNKRQGESSSAGEQSGQQSGQKPGQRSEHPSNDLTKSQKRPSQGGEDDQDKEQKEQGGQRRAS